MLATGLVILASAFAAQMQRASTLHLMAFPTMMRKAWEHILLICPILFLLQVQYKYNAVWVHQQTVPAAFGATINISTNEFNKNAYAESNNSYGSFNTWKNTIKVGSGLINDHFTVDARLSRITSDGYIDRASSNLKSFYISAAYIGKKTSLRLNIFSGKEKTYQAWYGIPR